MSYTIDIIDTKDNTHSIAFESSGQSDVILSWQGGDDKALLNIVPSSLQFTIVDVTHKDAFFLPLLTSEETRFKVHMYKTDDNTTIWTGFILPDQYAEPYTNGNVFASFEAADGLGRIKGKYLPDAFYEKEKSVTAFIGQCLKLTGLEMDVWFSPAIVNRIEKNYENIYLLGEEFAKGAFNLDAYNVLTEILFSMACLVYQCENRWVVEGFNKRQLSKVNYRVYNYDGTEIGQEVYLRTLKALTPVAGLQVTAEQPLGEIVISHKRRPQALPETIAVEKNEGWAVGQGVVGDVFPTYWFSHGGYLPKAISPKYQIALPTKNSVGFNLSQYISLKDKLYVKQYEKLVFSAKFRSEVSARQNNATTESGILLVFLLNGNEIYHVSKIFEDDQVLFQFDIYANQDGLLDLRLYQPYFLGNYGDDTYARHIFVEELLLEVIGFTEDEIFKINNNEEFTTKQEIELYFSDDASGFSKAFRLAKLNDQSGNFNSIDIPVLYTFQQNEKYYAVVALYGANLVADNIDSVYEGGVLLSNLAVFYNYQNGEQMVVESDAAVTAQNLTVRRYTTNDVEGSRKHWEQWTDDNYGIEIDRYSESMAKVYNRLFPATHEKFEFTALGAFKFNDLIGFKYIIPRQYFLTNLQWNVSRGRTSGIMVRSIYQNNNIEIGGDELGPIVDAGLNVFLPTNFGKEGSYTHTTASAFDPDGFIVSYKWTVESNNSDYFFTGGDSLTPRLVRFDSDVLVLRLTVIDNDGVSSSDTVTFTKESSATASLVNDLNFLSDPLDVKRDIFVLTPALATNYSIKLKGRASIDVIARSNYFSNTIAILTIKKNGTVINKQTFVYYLRNNEERHESFDFEVNYIDGDQISFEHHVQTPDWDFFEKYALLHRSAFEVYSIQFNQGNGNILGLPVISEKLMYTDE